MRGGIDMESKCYTKANNPYIDGYNRSQPTKYIAYLDANQPLRFSNVSPLHVPIPASAPCWSASGQDLAPHAARQGEVCAT